MTLATLLALFLLLFYCWAKLREDPPTDHDYRRDLLHQAQNVRDRDEGKVVMNCRNWSPGPTPDWSHWDK